MYVKLVLISCLAIAAQAAEPVVNLPNLGTIQGRVHQTFGNGVPKKDYFNFRNIPFAESVSGNNRFKVIFEPVWIEIVTFEFI